MRADQDVGGLEVAVDDPLLVRVLHGAADLDEQVQTTGDRELRVVADDFEYVFQVVHHGAEVA